MTDARYYLQVANESYWEKVDEYTHRNWDKAQTAEGTQRYNGNGVIHGKEGVFMRCVQPMHARDYALVARFTNAGTDVINPNFTMHGGIVREPEYVPLVLRKKKVLRDIKNEASWACKG